MNEKIVQNNNLDVTQRTAIIKSRMGQGVFRHRIMKKYSGKCVITGIDIEKCLIASHIKPWAACNNEERLSENNGLLLSATYDKLFDSGLEPIRKLLFMNGNNFSPDNDSTSKMNES